MARIVLLQPYEMLEPGAVMETDGGRASVLIARRMARLAKPGEMVNTELPQGETDAPKAEKKSKRNK
jgi:hypothetical protein